MAPYRVGEHRDGAGGDRLRREVGAVRAGTGQCGVEVSGRDGPGVQGATADEHAGGVDAEAGHQAGERVERSRDRTRRAQRCRPAPGHRHGARLAIRAEAAGVTARAG